MSKTLTYVKQAILSEIEGYEFYRMAAKDAREDQIKETYLQLAEEERKHVEWLEGVLKKLMKEDVRFELEQVEAPPSPDFFNWSKLDRESPQTTLSVIGIALQLERASYDYYLKAVEDVEDEDARQLFKILAAWEKAHRDSLNKEYEMLQSAWWAEQRFSPY